jgi:hypothetical protein
METENQFTTTVQYRLIILISTIGIALSVYDEANSLVSTKKMKFGSPVPTSEEIIRLLSSDSQMNFSNVRVIVESDNYSFVPDAIFRPADAQILLGFEHKPEKSEQLLFSSVIAWNCVNVFSIESAIYTALIKLFPNTEVEHHLSYVLTDKVIPQVVDNLYIWVRNKKMDVVVLSNGELKLVNSYLYATPEDVTYHTLNVIEQLALNVDTCKVTLLNTEKRTELKVVLEKYVSVSL